MRTIRGGTVCRSSSSRGYQYQLLISWPHIFKGAAVHPQQHSHPATSSTHPSPIHLSLIHPSTSQPAHHHDHGPIIRAGLRSTTWVVFVPPRFFSIMQADHRSTPFNIMLLASEEFRYGVVVGRCRIYTTASTGKCQGLVSSLHATAEVHIAAQDSY